MSPLLALLLAALPLRAEDDSGEAEEPGAVTNTVQAAAPGSAGVSLSGAGLGAAPSRADQPVSRAGIQPGTVSGGGGGGGFRRDDAGGASGAKGGAPGGAVSAPPAAKGVRVCAKGKDCPMQGGTMRLEFQEGDAWAVKFKTGRGASGMWSTVFTVDTPKAGRGVEVAFSASISKAPGGAPEGGCKGGFSRNGGVLRTDDKCRLKPYTDYYFNMKAERCRPRPELGCPMYAAAMGKLTVEEDP